MFRPRPRLLVALVVNALLMLTSLVGIGHARAGGGSSTIMVVASGLDHPKGLAFGPDGSLYIAESGHSNGTCPPPTQTQSVTSKGATGAVARVSPDGTLTRIATGLNSSCDAGDYIGPSGVLVSGTDVYILQGNCTGAFSPNPNAPCDTSEPLLRLAGGRLQPVAQFISRGNGDKPNEPDEDPYAIAGAPDGSFVVSDGANNTIWRFRPGAGLQSVSAPVVQFPHDPTLTGVAVDASGAVYVALFGKAPWPAPLGSIARVTPDGRYTTVRGGLYTPIGVAMSPSGALYILTYSSQFVFKPFPHFLPNTGRVWRLGPGGALQPVVGGLNFPTAMTFGPNGNLYVVNNGTGVAPTAIGQVLSVYVGQ